MVEFPEDTTIEHVVSPVGEMAVRAYSQISVVSAPTSPLLPTDERLESGRFRVIVVALDGSAVAERGLRLARGIAERDGSRIVLVHVQEMIIAAGSIVPVEPDDEKIQARIRELATQLSDARIQVDVQVCEVAVGGPAEVIASAADQAGADLIVAGTKGHSALGTLIKGSTTQRLLRIANQPVLMVPAEKG